MAKRKSTAHYVDNKVFLQAMKDWKEQCEEAEQMGEEKPRVSNYIGECFLKIANGLSPVSYTHLTLPTNREV